MIAKLNAMFKVQRTSEVAAPVFTKNIIAKFRNVVQLLNAGRSWHGKITVARWHDPSCFMLLVDGQTYNPAISSGKRCAWWHIIAQLAV